MDIRKLIKKYRENLKNGDTAESYSILLFALQLPSTCSRIEFPKEVSENKELYDKQGRPLDKKLYQKWLQKYECYFKGIYCAGMTFGTFCDSIYDLRNRLTHEGVLTSDGSKYYFVNDTQMAMIFGDIVFMSIGRLCGAIFNAAENALSDKTIEVTHYRGLVLPDEKYEQIRKIINDSFDRFWAQYSEENNLLYVIYETNFIEQAERDKADNFFEKSPNGYFKVHGLRLCGISKEQYDKMKEIVEKVDECAEQVKSEVNQHL